LHLEIDVDIVVVSGLPVGKKLGSLSASRLPDDSHHTDDMEVCHGNSHREDQEGEEAATGLRTVNPS
jgi:hypothetical protein